MHRALDYMSQLQSLLPESINAKQNKQVIRKWYIDGKIKKITRANRTVINICLNSDNCCNKLEVKCIAHNLQIRTATANTVG